jgi:16S rRNA (adenine1518-N6/adenine1519-N6)-dimethyltransferase
VTRFATATELRQALEARGLRPRRNLGQNFLVDLNLLRCVADAAELGPSDVTLEIGCGAGALTALLAERAARVVAIEIDAGLHALARESLAGHANARLVLGDAMGRRGRLSEGLLNAVHEALAAVPCSRLKLAANLPYCIATAAIKALLLYGPTPVSMAVTVQREVAERLVAQPATREYGLMGVLVQTAGKPEVLRSLPPQVFWPRPKVESALVRIRLAQRPDADLEAIERVAGSLLEQRRKTVGKAMLLTGLAQTREQAVALLAECGTCPERRPDALTVEEFGRLARTIGGRERP